MSRNTEQFPENPALENYLDKSERKNKKYFTEKEEEAVLLFINVGTSDTIKLKMFKDVITPAFYKLVDGVLEIPSFHNIAGIDRQVLKEDCFSKLIEKISYYNPENINTEGNKSRAYSYFTKIAINYVLETKQNIDKKIMQKKNIDYNANWGVIADKVHDTDNEEIQLNFETLIKDIQIQVNKVIAEHKNNKNVNKVGAALVYMLKHWHKLDFQTKNEFMRMLCLYTGLKQQIVAQVFKSFKIKLFESGLLKEREIDIKDSDEVDEEITVEFEDIIEEKIVDNRRLEDFE